MKKHVATITGTIAGITIVYLVQQFFFNSTSTFDKILMEIASDLNRTCPVMIDSETRLDNAIALPNKIFQYNYTLVNWDKEHLDTVELKEYLVPYITNFTKSSPDMKSFRDNNVTTKYCYRDKLGTYVFTITVTSEQ